VFAVSFGFALVAAFADGFAQTEQPTLVGDLCGALAALLWAATTVLIRATRLARVSATKVLLYQLAISAMLLPLASVGDVILFFRVRRVAAGDPFVREPDEAEIPRLAGHHE